MSQIVCFLLCLYTCVVLEQIPLKGISLRDWRKRTIASFYTWPVLTYSEANSLVQVNVSYHIEDNFLLPIFAIPKWPPSIVWASWFLFMLSCTRLGQWVVPSSVSFPSSNQNSRRWKHSYRSILSTLVSSFFTVLQKRQPDWRHTLFSDLMAASFRGLGPTLFCPSVCLW